MSHQLLQSKGKRPRTGAVLQCPECSQEFYASPGQVERRKYCSRNCKERAQQRQIRTQCVMCGTAFEQAQSVGGKYCTRACYLKDRQPRKACKTCGTPLARTKLTYCSQACLFQGRRTGSEKPCQQCGVVMYVEPNQSNKRYCSRSCQNEGKRLTGPGWKWRRPDGYVAVYYPTHPDATKAGWVLEHRLVAEEKYGRRILKTEHVNHINGIKDDNRPENLETISPSDHAGISNKQGAAQRKAMKAELAALREEVAAYRERYGPLVQGGYDACN